MLKKYLILSLTIPENVIKYNKDTFLFFGVYHHFVTQYHRC